MRLKNKILAILLSAVCMASFVACASPEVEEPENEAPVEQIDISRTQLFVNNFYGGYGSDWLSAVKKRYEELHKDDVYEKGKKGIQIYINNKKDGASSVSSQILDNRDEIYFSEYSYYRTLKSEGVLADITEAVTGDLEPYGDPAGSTIESKLNAQQQEFYGIEENGKTHYYGLPHYSGYVGIVYNVDLFDKKGYYFRDGYEDWTDFDDPSSIVYEDTFVLTDKQAKKSAGPDGKYNTSDDGLPTTYEEFFLLLKCIQSGGDTAISWNGKDYTEYLGHLAQALVADYEGKEQMMLNYNLGDSGKAATNLGKIQDGVFVRDEASTKITVANGYETARQQGKYEALKFLRELCIPANDKYHNRLAFNGGYSHMNAQEDFLYAGNDGGKTPDTAMLVEGIWWESEATATFNKMTAAKGEAYSKTSRHFGFMPLPKANADKVKERKSTLFDHIYSICFVKSNIAEWKKPIALDFIKFVHTNESLVEFTTITNTPKAFDYKMEDKDLAKMSPFGRSVLEYKAASDVVYPYSTNSVYIQHQSTFETKAMFKTSATSDSPARDFRENGTTAESYFSAMESYYRNSWDSIIK